MSIDERDRRATAGGREAAAGRAPRSGGRTTGQHVTTQPENDGSRRTAAGYTPADRTRADRTPTGRTSAGPTSAGRTPAGPTSAGRTSAVRVSAGRVSAGRVPGVAGQPETSAHPTRGTAALQLDQAEPIGATAAAAPRLRVAPPAPIRTPRAPFIALVTAIVLAGVLGILWINTKTMENTFRISQLQDQQSALDNQQQQLERQIAGYENTGNLDAAARMLGLVKSDRLAYITLPNGDVIGVPQPNTGPPAVTAKGTRPAPDAGADRVAGR